MAEPIIRVIFGDQWVAAAPIAMVLALAALPTGLFALAPQMLSATGNVRRRLNVSLWFCLAHTSGVVFASQFSLVAVACVWIVSNIFMLGLYVRHLRQVLGISASQLLRPCLSSVLVAGVSVVIQFSVWLLAGKFGIPSPAMIPLVLAAGAGAWLLAARSTGHPAYGEIITALKAINRRNRAILKA